MPGYTQSESDRHVTSETDILHVQEDKPQPEQLKLNKRHRTGYPVCTLHLSTSPIFARRHPAAAYVPLGSHNATLCDPDTLQTSSGLLEGPLWQHLTPLASEGVDLILWQCSKGVVHAAVARLVRAYCQYQVPHCCISRQAPVGLSNRWGRAVVPDAACINVLRSKRQAGKQVTNGALLRGCCSASMPCLQV